MKKECVVCRESDNSYLFHTCRNNAGDTITVCDFCFQDIAAVKKVNGEGKVITAICFTLAGTIWKEFILENGKEYFIVKK